MARRVEPPDSLDFFPTPPWAVRAFCDRLDRLGLIEGERPWKGRVDRPSCWEPACGEGHMARALAEWFDPVVATDIHDYGWAGQSGVLDFTSGGGLLASEGPGPVDWIITNPPFRLAEAFALAAIDRARVGAALLVRPQLLEGEARYERLWRAHPPALVLQYVERVPMVKGRVDQTASTATAYCWIVWLKGHAGPVRFDWIPKSRHVFEATADYLAPTPGDGPGPGPLFGSAA